METLKARYIIPGECVPKGRPRFTRRSHAYTPAKTKLYEKQVKEYLIAQGAKPSDKPLEVWIYVYKQPLKSWSKKLIARATRGLVLADKKPDVDNYTKSVLDASNKLLFNDDKQVVSLHVIKAYAPKAFVVIESEELECLKIDKDHLMAYMALAQKKETLNSFTPYKDLVGNKKRFKNL